MHCLHAGSVFGSRAADASQVKLQAWVKRELRAVLRVEDVSLLTSLVMGIALSYKAMCRPSEQLPGSNEHAVRALEPYLGPDAKHFWHELRQASVKILSLTDEGVIDKCTALHCTD